MIELEPGVLKGCFTPVVTPFRDGAVDFAAFEQLVERQVAGGSRGVVVAGTSGEPSLLTSSERRELVGVAARCVAGRAGVVAATGAGSHAETVTLSEEAVRAGADALLVVTPFYLRPPQRGLVEYFVDVARRFEIPVLIYHIPGRAAVSLEVGSIESIAEGAENLVGMKHASTELGLVTEVLKRLGPEFRVFVGLEELSLPMLALGACGLMNALGNLLPDRVAALWHAVDEERLGDALKIHNELWELNRAIFFDTNPIPVKYMLRRMGLIQSNEHRLPMVPASPELERRLDQVMLEAGLLAGEHGSADLAMSDSPT